MNIIMQPIQVIVWHSKEGVMRPWRYKIEDNGEEAVIQIIKVLTRSEEKLAGCRDFIFGCQGIIQGCLKGFELKYKMQSCKWFLYKI